MTCHNLIYSLRPEYQADEGAQRRAILDALIMLPPWAGGTQDGGDGFPAPRAWHLTSGQCSEHLPALGAETIGCLLTMHVNPASESTAVMANKELLFVYTYCLFPLSIKPLRTRHSFISISINCSVFELNNKAVQSIVMMEPLNTNDISSTISPPAFICFRKWQSILHIYIFKVHKLGKQICK